MIPVGLAAVMVLFAFMFGVIVGIVSENQIVGDDE